MEYANAGRITAYVYIDILMLICYYTDATINERVPFILAPPAIISRKKSLHTATLQASFFAHRFIKIIDIL